MRKPVYALLVALVIARLMDCRRRKYYERNNFLIAQVRHAHLIRIGLKRTATDLMVQYLYIDRLLAGSMPYSLIEDYQRDSSSSNAIPSTITEEPSTPITPFSMQQQHTGNGSLAQPKRPKRTPTEIYRLPSDETTPLLSADGTADGPTPECIAIPPSASDAHDSATTVNMAIAVNFAANVLLLAGKIAVLALTSSLSVLASLVDGVLDFLSTAILWTTAQLVARGSRDAHAYPVGRRRLEPLGVLVFSVVMITSFAQVALECIQRLVSEGGGHAIRLGWPAIGIMLGTVVVKGCCWLWCRLVRNSSVQALAQDALTDGESIVRLGFLKGLMLTINSRLQYVQYPLSPR